MFIFYLFFITFTHVASAQNETDMDFAGFVGLLTDLIGTLVFVVFTLTFFVFLWGVIKNVLLKGGSPESLKAGKNIMFWGILVLVIMVAIWGILAILQRTFFGG